MIKYSITTDFSATPEYKRKEKLVRERARIDLQYLELEDVIAGFPEMTAIVKTDTEGESTEILIEPLPGHTIPKLSYVKQKLYTKYDGDMPFGIMFYNAGPDELRFSIQMGPRRANFYLISSRKTPYVKPPAEPKKAKPAVTAEYPLFKTNRPGEALMTKYPHSRTATSQVSPITRAESKDPAKEEAKAAETTPPLPTLEESISPDLQRTERIETKGAQPPVEYSPPPAEPFVILPQRRETKKEAVEERAKKTEEPAQEPAPAPEHADAQPQAPAADSLESVIKEKKNQAFEIRGRFCIDGQMVIAGEQSEEDYDTAANAIRELPFCIESSDGSPALVVSDSRRILITPRKGTTLSLPGYEQALSDGDVIERTRSREDKKDFRIKGDSAFKEYLVFTRPSRLLEMLETTGIEGRLAYQEPKKISTD